MANENTTRITTGPARISYAYIWDPKPKSGKYEVLLLIPKTDTETLLKIKNAVEAAYQLDENIIKGNAKSCPSLASIRTPLHDGDAEKPGEELYQGMMYLNATAKKQPLIVDAEKKDITDREVVYSGCWCRAVISFYGYNQDGGKGISTSLRGLQKVKDDVCLFIPHDVRDDF